MLILDFLTWWLKSIFLLNLRQNIGNICLLDHLVKQNIIDQSFSPNFESQNDHLLILDF
jgi:hypothetical protein